MSGSYASKRGMFIATAAAVPALVLAACTIQLRGDADGPPVGPTSRITNPRRVELERCRKVTTEQVTELQNCRVIWAEDRQRFLTSRKTSVVSSVDAQPGGLTPPIAGSKRPGRLPQGWTPSATPERD